MVFYFSKHVMNKFLTMSFSVGQEVKMKQKLPTARIVALMIMLNNDCRYNFS